VGSKRAPWLSRGLPGALREASPSRAIFLRMTEAAAAANARDGVVIATETIGEAWLAIAGHILTTGVAERYDALPILEVSHATLVVARPDADDALIAEHGDPDRLQWMRANFADHARVEALGGARSYASRIFDYAAIGRDQLAWVIERLRADPASRDAAITTFEPLTDTTYIPCVSLLDFWIRDGAVELVVYAHSIDFGAKGYGNLTELALLQHTVATALQRPVGALHFAIKSAHVYETERAYMRAVLDASPPRPRD
jgi:thymidylate synthase